MVNRFQEGIWIKPITSSIGIPIKSYKLSKKSGTWCIKVPDIKGIEHNWGHFYESMGIKSVLYEYFELVSPPDSEWWE